MKDDKLVHPIPLRDIEGAFTGLTRRELFAAMAMQGINANLASINKRADYVAQASVACADALIEELDNGE